MSTPTPRTDAAWAKTFQDDEDQCRAGNAATDMRDECATLERELAALAAERDQLRAQLHALNLVCGTTDADKFQTWVDRANARAERAEAELAAERARLDWLQAQEVKRGLEITEGHDDPLPFLVLDEDGTTHWGDTYRAAIDAAMKEGAK